jgi:RAD54-like protein 2
VTNLRRNIREVMDESELDEETKAAQRQEMERLRRVQEQQRIIREVQRQIMMQNKQRGRPSINLQSSSSLLRQCTITTTGGSSNSANASASGTGSATNSGVSAQHDKNLSKEVR